MTEELRNAIESIDKLLKNQRLTITEHDVVQRAWMKIVRAAHGDKNGDDG